MKKEDFTNFFRTNKATWNKKVAYHTVSEFYNVEAFKNGATSLNVFELEALGDVNEKSLLHLQCHFGQDTLSWSRLGAICTGIDFSEKAIAYAKKLSKSINVTADFVCCNVLDTSSYVDEQFDIVFTSYGTIGWLPDLMPWGNMIAERLKFGGLFYIVDFHPVMWMFDYVGDSPQLMYGYNQDDVIYEEYRGTYAQKDAPMVSKEYGWNHGIGEVINALVAAGLTVECVNEYTESPYDVFPNLICQENGLFTTKDKFLPMLFEIKAIKS